MRVAKSRLLNVRMEGSVNLGRRAHLNGLYADARKEFREAYRNHFIRRHGDDWRWQSLFLPILNKLFEEDVEVEVRVMIDLPFYVIDAEAAEVSDPRRSVVEPQSNAGKEPKRDGSDG